jgi:hypothetical protein
LLGTRESAFRDHARNKNCVKPLTDRAPHLSDKGGKGGATVKEVFMLNRIPVIGLAVAVAAALLVVALVTPALGPRASRADLASPSLSIDQLHRQVDYRQLPVHAIPLP